MIPTTANFDTYRNSTAQAPVIVLSMPSLGLLFTNRPGQPGMTPTNTFAQMPTGISQKISDLQGTSTIGAITVTVVDVGRAILGLFASKQWYGAKATLQLGFAGLTYPTDYMTYFSGVVASVVPTADHTGMTFTIQDMTRTLKKQCYAIGDDGATPTSATNPKTLYADPMSIALDLLENQLGIAAAAIDTTAITAIQAGRLSSTRMLFTLTKAVDGLTFLEQELLRPNGLFHFTRYDGRISVGDVLSPPMPVTSAFSFTDSNTQGIPTFRQSPIYNWVEFQLDYDGSNYRDIEEFTDAASIAKFGLQTVLSIQSQGLKTNLQGATRAGVTARRIFSRYANGPASMISLTATGLQAVKVEVGDYADVSNSKMEDLDTGVVGWNNRICQVVGVTPNWAANTISFDLIDVNPTLRPAYQLAPDTVPVWTSATGAQKAQYMFQANAASKMSDGTEANGIY